MSDFHWKLIKKIVDSLPKPPNRKALLFTRDWIAFTDKLPFISSEKAVTNPFVNSSSAVDSIGTENQSNIESVKHDEKVLQGQRYAVDKIFQGFKSQINTQPSNKEDLPKWKTQSSNVSLVSINSRTSMLLTSVISAENRISRLKRLEELNSHFKKYPEGKNYSVKTGAVRILLSLRKESDDPTQEIINENLSLLGYCDPPNSSGIRILSIDGGGVRGIAVIKMLELLEQMSGKKAYQLFDYICGVSTGAIITCCMVPPLQLSMKDLYQLYMDLSQKVFKQNALWGTSKLVFSRAYYETSVWETLLKQYVGDTSMLESTRKSDCPKISALSTLVNQLKVTPFLFRNYSLPYLRSSDYHGSSSHTMFEAIRASAAAPTIFEEFRTGDLLHQDGGILVNNPTAVAIHEVKSLWPDEKISCIVSCGTGRYIPVPTMNNIETATKLSSSWKIIFDKILDSATDTEAVHMMLNDLLPEDVYHRFNPHLTETIAMDEIREDKIQILEEDTMMYCRRNEDKFHTVVDKLTENRSALNKCRDFVQMKIKLSGYAL